MLEIILNSYPECLVRFKKETCDKYFYPKVSVGKVYSELLVEKVEKKLKEK